MKNLIILLSLFVTLSCSKNINDLDDREEIFWEQTASIDKRVDVLIIDSKDNILVGAEYGRLYRSTDSGNSWTNLNNGLLDILFSIKSIAVNSKGHIFVSSGQIYRSTDQGQNWVEVSNNQVRADYLLINSKDEIYGLTCCGYIYRSSNNGDAWEKAGSKLEFFSPSSININSKGVLFVKENDGVFRSMDNGNTWTKIKDGYTYALTINNYDEIFVITGDAYTKTFYTSKDNGWSWSRISNVTTTDVVINSKGIMYGINGTIGVVRSVDGGKSWKEINSGLKEIFTRRLAINSRGYIFAGTASYDKYSQLGKGDVFKSIKSTLE